MKFILSLLLLSSVVQASIVDNDLVFSGRKSSFIDMMRKTSFRYFMSFTGPTLKGRKGDTTYSKFQTGFDRNGKKLDGAQSINAFHNVGLSYQYTKNLRFSLSYSYDTFHGDDVKFRWPDGSEAQRTTRGSQYDPRVMFFLSNIYQNKFLGFSSGLGFDIPLIDSSRDNKLNTTLVLSPSLYFKKVHWKFQTGINSMIEKFFYQEQERVNSYNLKTLSIVVAPYLNYRLSNKWQLNSRVEFDWDQRAEQTNTTNFGHNMVNSYRLGFTHLSTQAMNWGSFLEAIIGDTKLETTSVGAFFSLTI